MNREKELAKLAEQITAQIDRYEELKVIEEENFDNSERGRIHYGSRLSLYGQLSLELDKSILGLSSGGIGLLMAIKIPSSTNLLSPCQLFLTKALYGIAFFSFLIAVVSVLLSFKYSKAEVVDSYKRQNGEKSPWNGKIKAADKASQFTFVLGLISASIYAYIEKI